MDTNITALGVAPCTESDLETPEVRFEFYSLGFALKKENPSKPEKMFFPRFVL